MIAKPVATLMPRAQLEARQLDGILGGGTSTTTVAGGSGGTTAAPVSTSSSSSSSSAPISTSSSSSTPTSSSTTPTTSQQPVTSTSSARATITSAITSNGVVTQTVLTTESPTVVTSTPTSTSSRQTGGSSKSNGAVIGGVVGGVVGGLALLTLIVLAIIVWRRRKARTGHGWLLCLGRRPERKDELDVDWPTFDPAIGAAGVGGTFGADAMGRRRSGNAMGNVGTLPDVDDPYYAAGSYGGQDEMSAYSGPASYVSPTSDGTHQRQHSQQWHMSSPPMSSVAEAPSVPDYSHLDAPEVREERARQQAQAQAHAQAMAAATAAAAASHSHSHSGNKSPSPPPAEHRFSQGTTQMLSDNNFFMAPQHDESGTLQPTDNRHGGLHLHNPDA